MGATVEKATISDFRKNMKVFTQDRDIEAVLTRSGKPIGAYIGIDTWRATQKTLNLFRDHPQELLRSLVLHQRFHETGKPEGISLEEFTVSLKQKI